MYQSQAKSNSISSSSPIITLLIALIVVNGFFFANLTVEAKKLFNEFCAYLQNNPKKVKQQPQLKNMYCTSAASYQPVVASISESTEKDTELAKAKSKCNSLIMKTMNTRTESDVNKRDAACSKYKEMKKQLIQ
ncbi:MAG: hypothetical protein KZQ83_18465 [gamma proteobacterium symbiont of Taylorina sp.]|nr:hypothetical protein [gamma proteobacterium symbiont of Taylorina sp.]